MIEVFHGTDHILKKPMYMGGRNDNDYGNGFYTTEYEDRARSWAALNGRENAIVNVYELEIDALRVLNLNDYGVLAWIAEVVKNRGTEQESVQFIGDKLVELYCLDSANADIIKGYRADDSYTQVIEAFLLNQINIAEVERLFYKGSLGNQIFLKSPRAFEHIRWKNSYTAHLEKNDTQADLNARKEVNRFLSGRMKAILLEGFEVPGITARYAIQNHLVYHQEGGYYE